MRRVGMGLLVVVALLAGCDGTGAEGSTDAASKGTLSSAPTTPQTTTATTGSPTTDFAVAVDICTERMAEPDTLVREAVAAARAGTRSVTEIAEAFREAQDVVENLAEEAEAGGFLRLAPALQAYADVLGRARVSGDAGVSEMTETREAINLACYTP